MYTVFHAQECLHFKAKAHTSGIFVSTLTNFILNDDVLRSRTFPWCQTATSAPCWKAFSSHGTWQSSLQSQQIWQGHSAHPWTVFGSADKQPAVSFIPANLNQANIVEHNPALDVHVYSKPCTKGDICYNLSVQAVTSYVTFLSWRLHRLMSKHDVGSTHTPGLSSRLSWDEANMKTYRDKLFQSPLREDAVEFGTQLALGQDGKHDTLQHHSISAL